MLSELLRDDLRECGEPIAFEWRAKAVSEAAVLAADMRENEAIYLWLKGDASDEPRVYVLPWNLEMAKQLSQATAQAEAQGTGVRMRGLFETQIDPGEPMFYAEPQPALPPKQPLS